MRAPASSGKLYTPEILALAVELADYPLDPGYPLSGEARSRSCGSNVSIGLSLSANGAIDGLGLAVTACAIGQAAAAIFARQVAGRTADQLARDAVAVARWLESGEADSPWPGIELLEPARSFPARHGAILLPWKAALDALSNAEAES